jgi:tetratricopeptide (TPR) repeat protein
MTLFKFFPVLLVVFTRIVGAQPIDIDQITAASYESDIAALESMLAETAGASYENAYLKYRLAIGYNSNGQSKQSDRLLKATVDELDAVLEQRPDSAEAYALQGTAMGMRISFRPSIRGISMGPASNRAIARAIELDPSNPRVWLIKGIGAHNTPALFGGGNAKALLALDKAIALFEDNGTGWGFADAYVWRGLTYKSRGDLGKARADFQAALLVAPNFRWAGRLLNDLDAGSATL